MATWSHHICASVRTISHTAAMVYKQLFCRRGQIILGQLQPSVQWSGLLSKAQADKAVCSKDNATHSCTLVWSHHRECQSLVAAPTCKLIWAPLAAKQGTLTPCHHLGKPARTRLTESLSRSQSASVGGRLTVVEAAVRAGAGWGGAFAVTFPASVLPLSWPDSC